MHPCQEQIADHILRVRRNPPKPPSARRQGLIDAIQAYLGSLELHDDFAIGHYLGALVLLPSRSPDSLLPFAEWMAARVRERPDLYPGGEVQKVILLFRGTSRVTYAGELGRLGAFDIGDVGETFRRLFEGYEAARRFSARPAKSRFQRQS